MGVFKLAQTFENPAASQSGFATPGAGAQTTGDPTYASTNDDGTVWEAKRPTKGFRSWFAPAAPASEQQGFPSPEAPGQRRPAGSMQDGPPIWGGVYMHETPYYDRGAAAFVPNFGKVLQNPIGAGIYAPYRTQATYGMSSQYINGALWWTSQVVPTSVNLQGLTDPEELAAIFDQLQVQAVVRTTG